MTVGAVAGSIARIVAPTVEQFVPQMVNLELVGGVNFQKGCYPGQEIVARSQYRGTLDATYEAIDPVRGADMDYTAPYVIIEGAYLVRNNSPLTRNEEVDRPGTRVMVGRGSAYDLFLTREIKQATLLRSPTSPAVVDNFLAQNASATLVKRFVRLHGLLLDSPP